MGPWNGACRRLADEETISCIHSRVFLGCGQEEDHAAFQTDGYVKQACDDLSAKAFKIIILIILHIVRTPAPSRC